jgi:ABC-type phosphate transport system auxiliary subunit
MTRVELDGEDAADGLTALVVALVEVVVETMEQEAVRRMEAGQLSDEEVERVGSRFAEIEAELERLKDDADVAGSVEDLRAELDRDLVHATDAAGEPAEPSTADLGVFDDA